MLLENSVFIRSKDRLPQALRPVHITRNYIAAADSSVLIEQGETKVICTASLAKNVPRWMKEQNIGGKGWISAEYGMIPRSTVHRMDREAVKGKQTGRTQEIQRLIGRALRAAVDLNALGEYTIMVDCDVISADGGTRSASITGGCIALFDLIQWMKNKKWVKTDPFKQFIAAVSIGICEKEIMVDLDYLEDSKAEVDMNIVMTEKGEFVEIQGTAENGVFSHAEFSNMIHFAKISTKALIQKQKEALNLS